MKLTGACTLLSNALSSEASPGPPLRHCLPVPGLIALPGPTAPPHLALPLTLLGVCQRRGAQLSAPVPGKGARRRVLAAPPSPPTLFSIWQLCVPAGPPTVGTCVPLASGEEVKRSVEMRPRAWQRLCCHQAQSALGPADVTGPQTLPATWTKLSLAPEWQEGGAGRKEESLVYQGRERGCAGPAVGPSMLCEPT